MQRSWGQKSRLLFNFPTSASIHPLSQKRESTIRNLLRNPVEHNLWQTFYPVIAEWSQRPYFRDTAMKLTIGASRFCFAAMSAEHYPYALRKWRSVQADFIAETEYQSFGAISTKLLESGDGVSAELICEMAARRGAAIEKAQRSQAQKRHELKRMLSESGLSSLLADERYVPAAFETLGDVPAKIDPANPQFSIFSPPRLKVVVKSVYAPIERTDGFRVLCDHFPPRIYPVVLHHTICGLETSFRHSDCSPGSITTLSAGSNFNIITIVSCMVHIPVYFGSFMRSKVSP